MQVDVGEENTDEVFDELPDPEDPLMLRFQYISCNFNYEMILLSKHMNKLTMSLKVV